MISKSMRFLGPWLGRLAGGVVLATLPAVQAMAVPDQAGAGLDESLFGEPPSQVRPQVWWHWMDGNVTRDGIARDLVWMKRSGIGGLHYFDVSLGGAPVVESPLIYRSPEWRAAIRFAVEEADRHGLAMTIAASPGFSETGGPWVKPADAMKKLVWSETRVTGGEPVAVTLPRPPDVTGPFQALPKPPSIAELTAMATGQSLEALRQDTPHHYGDALVLAFPTGDNPAPPPVSMRTGEGIPLDTAVLADGDLATALDIPLGEESNPGSLLIAYEAPHTLRSATLYAPGSTTMFTAASVLPVLEVKRDGEWHAVAELPLEQVPTTISFAPVTGSEFRVVLEPFEDSGDSPASWQGAPGAIGFGFPDSQPETIRIAELSLSAEPRVNRFETKAGFTVADDYHALDDGLSPLESGIARDSVVDLTRYLRANGTLEWTPPPGEWRILRFGHSLLGTENHPAPPEGTGLEVDKYDGEAVARYLDNYLDIFRDASDGMIGERGIGAILTDSIEVGASNWTPRMVEHFQRLRGYDPRPWLPALAGVLVGSRADSDAFLFDFRRTLADLLAEQHYGTIADVAHRHGLKVYGEALENGRPSLGDDMAMRAHADFPMAAYWAHTGDMSPRITYIGDMRGAASLAHIHGGNIAVSESLTSSGFPWALAPSDLKPLVDIQFAHGINHIVIHSSVHQPLDDYLPGVSMASIGQFFNRHVTWADMARPWMDYIARNSYLLRQGRNVADVLYFHGEEAPLTALFADGRMDDLPEAFAYDFANAEVVLNHLASENGELVTSGGARYQALYLGGASRHMTLPVLRRIVALAEEGATVIGAPPQGSPGLGDDPGEYAALVKRLAARSVASGDIDAALLDRGLSPGFSCIDSEACDVLFVQRTSPEGEIFFLTNRSGRTLDFTGRFRVADRIPRLWRADSGEVEEVSFAIEGDHTLIPLHMPADEAFFLVFQDTAQVVTRTVPSTVETLVHSLDGPWQVAFQADRGAPAGIELAALGSLSEHGDTGVRYFSGVATYSHQLPLEGDLAELHLDLGDVADVAEVLVNGQSAGIVWKPPYRVAIGHLVKPGNNRLDIRVANLWANRLIGDAQPEMAKVTTIRLPTYLPEAPLRPSGLMGPVSLLRQGE